jgi:CHAT domain-containing protein/ketosteroid isomerase-like protein
MRYLNRAHQSIFNRRAFGLIACLVLCMPLQLSAQTQDESAVRAITEQFFAVYQKEDVKELMALWSRNSPDLSATEKAMRRAFDDNDKIQLHSLVITETKVAGDKATVRALVEMSAVEAKTGKAATAGFGKMSRTIFFVREDGAWKIWRYVSGEEELADNLLAAKTESERRTLLEERKESVNVALDRELTARGWTNYNRGEFVEGLDAAGLALKVAQQIGDTPGVSSALTLTGALYVASGDYPKALGYLLKALPLAEQLENKYYLASVSLNLGNVYDSMGDGIRAEEYYQKTLSIGRELKNPQYELAALNNLGNIYGSRGDRLRSLESYQGSLKLAEELKDKEAVSRTLASIGVLYSAQGSYEQALDFYQRSLALHEELGLRFEVPRLLGNIGLVYFRQGEYKSSLDYEQRALKAAEEIGDKEVIAGSLNMIGDVYMAQGDYRKALETYLRGLTLADDIGNKLRLTNALGAVGYVYLRLGDYRKALEYAERDVMLARQSDLPSPLWWAYNIAGQAQLGLNQPDLARRSLSEAVSTIEKMREMVAGGEEQRERFFENKVEPYYAMVDLSLAQNNYYEALDYGDRAKSRVLADVLSSGRIDIKKAMTAEEQERERKLTDQVATLNREFYREKLQQQPDPARLASVTARLQKARLEYEAFETGLYAAHPELKLRRGLAPQLTAARLGELLPDAKTAFLEFVVSDEKSYLFVLTRSTSTNDKGRVELKAYRLETSGKELAARVKDFRRRVSERDPEFKEAARSLYDLLLKPAAEQLRGKSLLGIIPDGILWELPFQALQPTENSYLIEEHALFYAPSLGVLYGIEKLPGKREAPASRQTVTRTASRGVARTAVPAASSSGAPTLLAFGNPSIGQESIARLSSFNRDEQLGPLPEAEREVATLREIYKPANSRVYIGAAAREKLAKSEMGDYSVLHFATHGVLDDLNPMYSHLVLSLSGEADGEDGLLHAWEVMRLDLKADVVVLSACQTARGRLGAGEGVVGMSWAMFVAGSPTTVASQWNVESSSTTQLMVEFHRNLLSSTTTRARRPTKAEALRRASLSVLKNNRYAHPFYWAGFIMMGDGMRPL